MKTICFENAERALSYHQNSHMQYHWAKSVLTKYQPLIQQCREVIDIGCGDGKVTAELLAMFCPQSQITALDLNVEMIKLAKQTYQSDRINFIVADVEKISYQNNFDLAFSSCCLQWLPNQEKALRNIVNSLVDNGILLIVMPGEGQQIFPMGKMTAEKDHWKPFFQNMSCARSYYTSDEYRELMSRLGLQPIAIGTTIAETSFDDKEQLCEWIKPICPYYHYLPVELREGFLNEVFQDLLKSCINPVKDKLILSCQRLEAYARKLGKMPLEN